MAKQHSTNRKELQFNGITCARSQNSTRWCVFTGLYMLLSHMFPAAFWLDNVMELRNSVSL